MEEHTELCEQIHTLLTQSIEAGLWAVAKALGEAEDAAHAECSLA